MRISPPPPPTDGPGGPVLVISSPSNPFSRYPVEMLRAGTRQKRKLSRFVKIILAS